MTTATFHNETINSRLHEVWAWLHQARAALSHAQEESRSADRPAEALHLSHERDSIERKVTAETARIGLLDLGWQPPRGVRRR